MIFTSYFANIRHIQASGTTVSDRMYSIARFTPKAIKIKQYPYLFPTGSLLTKYKAGNINEAEYEKEYRKDVLGKIDIDKAKRELADSILLCYEKPTEFCHRRIIRKWLAENGRLALEWQAKYKIAVAVKTDYTYESLGDYRKAIIPAMDALSGHQQDGQKERVSIVSDQLSESLAHRILPGYNIDTRCDADDMWKDADMGIVMWRKGNEDAEEAIRTAERHGKVALIYDYENHRFFVRNFEKVSECKGCKGGEDVSDGMSSSISNGMGNKRSSDDDVANGSKTLFR